MRKPRITTAAPATTEARVTRGGKKSRPDIPERRCIVTRKSFPRPLLIRFVVGREGDVFPDIAGKLPGRGIWVSSRRDLIERAVHRDLFSRAARQSVRVPANLAEIVEEGLVRRVTEFLSLARKAGLVVSGFERVREEVGGSRIGILLHARDGSERQLEKLLPGKSSTESSNCLYASELAMAFGDRNVIYAAVKGGRLAESVRQEVRRLSCFRE